MSSCVFSDVDIGRGLKLCLDVMPSKIEREMQLNRIGADFLFIIYYHCLHIENVTNGTEWLLGEEKFLTQITALLCSVKCDVSG